MSLKKPRANERTTDRVWYTERCRHCRISVVRWRGEPWREGRRITLCVECTARYFVDESRGELKT